MLLRKRPLYFIFLIIVIVIGYSTRRFPHLFPEFIAEYGGDTLWSLMFFIIFGLLFPKKKTFIIGLITLLFSFSIEISQLYQADWINTVRDTFPGAMLLGHGFLWSDLICYTIGILIGIIGEFILLDRR